MLKFSVDTTGLMKVQANIENMGKQARFAMARAINAAAYQATKATAKEMGRVFDRPTAWVLNSVRYVKANKNKLEARVDFDQWGNKTGVTVSHVLRAEIFGGRRKLKRHEVALQRAGILPPGYAIVPGAGATLDRYGNMSPGQIVQIMAWFRSFGEQGYRANMTSATRQRMTRGTKKKQGVEYFVVSSGSVRTWSRGEGRAAGRHRMQPGIYKRTHTAFGGSIKPVMIFVPIPAYRRALDFYGVAEMAVVAEFKAQFPKMLEEAVRTAK